jgi:hypothetical protein
MTDEDWTFGGSWPYEPHRYETADGRLHYLDEGCVDEGPRDVVGSAAQPNSRMGIGLTALFTG